MVQRQHYLLTLRPEPWCKAEFRELRHVLKELLRRHGLRCLSLEEVKPAAPERIPASKAS